MEVVLEKYERGELEKVIKNYMQVVTEKLIQEKNFRLSNLEYREDKVGFIIQRGEGPIIVEMYDVDSIPTTQMLSDIIAGVRNINMILTTPLDYRIYRIFISHDEIPDIILKAIKEAHVHDVYNRKYMKPIHVNVDKGTVTCYYNKAFPDYGILEVLYNNIEKEKWHERDKDLVLKLNEQKHREYSMNVASRRATTVYTLIVLNIVIYLVALIKAGDVNKYFEFMEVLGIKNNELIKQGEFYRLVAPIFLHADAIHVLANCYSLFMLGPLCEGIYGNLKFLLIYLISGIGGYIFSFALTPAQSLGASGAVFGILGAIAYIGIQKPITFKTVFGSSFMVVLALNIVLSFSVPSVDAWGHVGGFIAGFLMSGIVGLVNERRVKVKKAFALLMIIIFAGMLYMGFN